MAGRFSVEAVFKAVDRITAPMNRMQNRVSKFTRSVSRGLRKANKTVDSLVRGMGRGAKTVAKFGGAVLGIGSAATITALNRTAESADALAKQSRRLQFPIEELQEWKFVAEQSGVSNELLDKSLGAFSKRLGEAKGGMGPLVSGLKNINPELLQQLQNTDSVSDAFALYVDAMRNAETATEKAALANAGFSRSGLNLVNIADNSSASIKALREEQRQNGNITMQQAEAAEAYGDAVNSLKKSLMGTLQQVLLPMMPAITKNVRQWREWIIANKDLIRTRITEFAKNLWARIKALTIAVVEFSNKYDLPSLLGKGVDMLAKFASFLERNGKTIFTVIGAVVGLSVVLKTLAVVMAAVNLVMTLNPIGLVVLAIAAMIAAITAAIFYWDEIKAALVGFAVAVKDTVISAFTWLMDTFKGLPGPLQAAIALMAGPIGWLMGAASLVSSNWDGLKTFFTNLWDGVKEAFQSAWDYISPIVEKITGAVESVQNAVKKVTDFGSNAIEGAKDIGADVAEGARDAGTKVARFFGFGDDDEEDDERRPVPAGQNTGQMVSPQDRVARSVEESRSTSTSEVTIKDETGRAEMTKGKPGPGLKLQPSGAF